MLVFVLLQIIALNSYTSYLKYPESKVLTAAWSVSSYFLEIKNNITSYIDLKTNNHSLQKENILLRQKTLSNYVSINNKEIKIEDTILHQRYGFICANIINSTTNRRNNFFTLNAGSLQKIEKGMGVVSSNGIIGIVHSVSKHFSLVKSVLSKEINVAVEIEPSMHYGFLDWTGENAKIGLISGVSNDVPIKRNALIKTRGGLIFPKGIPVGFVDKTKNIEGKPEWEISIRFTEDYKRVQNVYIVKDLFFKEQQELENKLTTKE